MHIIVMTINEITLHSKNVLNGRLYWHILGNVLVARNKY